MKLPKTSSSGRPADERPELDRLEALGASEPDGRERVSRLQRLRLSISPEARDDDVSLVSRGEGFDVETVFRLEGRDPVVVSRTACHDASLRITGTGSCGAESGPKG